MRSSRDSFFSLPAGKSQISHPSDRSGHDIKYFWTNYHVRGLATIALSIWLYRLPNRKHLKTTIRQGKAKGGPLDARATCGKKPLSNWVRLPKPTSFKKPTEHATQWCWLCWKIELDKYCPCQHTPPAKGTPPKKMQAFYWGLMNHWLRTGVPFGRVGWPVIQKLPKFSQLFWVPGIQVLSLFWYVLSSRCCEGTGISSPAPPKKNMRPPWRVSKS